jgi:hypothetical protein
MMLKYLSKLIRKLLDNLEKKFKNKKRKYEIKQKKGIGNVMESKVIE